VDDSVTSIMVVTPHPDDAEISSGGSLAKWIAEGRQVVYVVCTDGDKGTGDLNITPEELAKVRRKEQLQAAAILGVREVVFLGHPDGGLEDTPQFREELVKLIKRFRPDTVMTSDPHRRPFQHRDHRMTGTVAIDACFPYARDYLFYPEHLAQGLLPHKVGEVCLWASDSPDVYIDISSTFSKKVEALCCHSSQLERLTAVGIERWLREMATRIGEPQGIPLAEAFRRVPFRR